jgi:hypothetical protein
MPSGYIPSSGNSSRHASSTRSAGVRPFAWPDMDSDDKEEQMFAEIFEEEMAAAAQDEEHLLILACLSGLYAETAIGRRGGSAPGHRKCKPRQRVEGYCILYQIRRTVMFICKNKPKTPISGRLPGVPAGSSALPTPNFCPIRRYLAPDFAVGSANGWRCS